jgi:serine protease Do
VKLEALGGDKGIETAGSEHGKGRWGLGLADLTPDARNELHANNQKSVHGAVVEEVKPGSPADNAGLQRGDVIMEVNRHGVKSASEAAQALSGVANGQDALVLVWSNGGSTFRVLHPSQG